MSIIGDLLDEENQVVHQLASLPESYDMLVMALEASSEVPKLEIVTERLLHDESKRIDKETTSTEVKAMTSNHRTTRRGPKCHNCGKIGHIRKDCRLLSEHFGKDMTFNQ